MGGAHFFGNVSGGGTITHNQHPTHAAAVAVKFGSSEPHDFAHQYDGEG